MAGEVKRVRDDYDEVQSKRVKLVTSLSPVISLQGYQVIVCDFSIH